MPDQGGAQNIDKGHGFVGSLVGGLVGSERQVMYRDLPELELDRPWPSGVNCTLAHTIGIVRTGGIESGSYAGGHRPFAWGW